LNPAAGPSDEQLVRRAQEGDESAFDTLIRRYEKKITSHVYAMLRDYDRALDLAQETFLRLLTRVDAYRETARFSTWLYRISTNLAIDEIRRRRRWRMVPFLGKGDQEWQDPAERPVVLGGPRPPSPEAPLLEDERRTMVRQAVATLPPHYRSAVVLKDLQDLPYDEVAEILEVPVGTVKSRVNRARTMLKDSLRSVLALSPAAETAGAGSETSRESV
jgi:RNA polymerase sigma-70 factor (ECF subfamily)